MSNVRSLVFVWSYLFLTFFGGNIAQNCLSNCVCKDFDQVKDGRSVICRYAEMDQIPKVLPNKTYSITLYGNNIVLVDNMTDFVGLRELNLAFNNISKITPTAFADLKNLEKLMLNGNQLTELPIGVFDNVVNLKELNLKYNQLSKLNLNIFAKLGVLEVLDLSYNPLKIIKPDLFEGLQKLRVLNLAHVNAYTLSYDAFYHIQDLQELDLSSNNFSKVPNEALRAAKIKKLNLDQNPIEMLNKDSFTELRDLETLQLSQMNKLTDIGRRTFGDLVNLRELTMTSNPSLTYLHKYAFLGIYNETWFRLEKVDLHNNRLTTLDGDVLPWCRVRILDFTGNPWTCDCRFRWIKMCSRSDITNGVRCAKPDFIRGLDITEIDNKDLFCQENAEREIRMFRIMVIILFSVMFVFLSVLVVVLVKRNQVAQWLRQRKGGSGAIYYVKAKSNPVDSDM